MTSSGIVSRSFFEDPTHCRDLRLSDIDELYPFRNNAQALTHGLGFYPKQRLNTSSPLSGLTAWQKRGYTHTNSHDRMSDSPATALRYPHDPLLPAPSAQSAPSDAGAPVCQGGPHWSLRPQHLSEIESGKRDPRLSS
jgi:hypothetical protein